MMALLSHHDADANYPFVERSSQDSAKINATERNCHHFSMFSVLAVCVCCASRC
jgi:hypothetical protein